MRADHLRLCIERLRPGAMEYIHYVLRDPDEDGDFIIGVWKEDVYGAPGPSMRECEDVLLDAVKSDKYGEMALAAELAFWDAFGDEEGIPPIIAAFWVLAVGPQTGRQLSQSQVAMRQSARNTVLKAVQRKRAVDQAASPQAVEDIKW